MDGQPGDEFHSVSMPSHPEGRRLSGGKRFLVAGGICLVVLAILAGTKFAQISSLIRAGKAAEAAGPPPEAVATEVASAASWDAVMDAVGSVAAARGVTLSTESAGVVRAIRFESGAKVRAGQVLVELDTSVERAQLASLNARRDLAETNASRTRQLVQDGAYTKAQLDNDDAQLKTVSADAGALKAQIERKMVRAPFAGKLGIREVNLGQFVNPGTPITVLESLESVFVDFTIPQQDAGARAGRGAGAHRAARCPAAPHAGRQDRGGGSQRRFGQPLGQAARERPGGQGRASPRHVRERVGGVARAGQRRVRARHRGRCAPPTATRCS